MDPWNLIQSSLLGVVVTHLKPFGSTSTDAGETRQMLLDILHARAERECPKPVTHG